jgi:DNA-binding response OmpR family regulator
MISEETNGERPLVLVADDDEDVRALVKLRLEQAECQVLVAGNGKRAYELAVEYEPDIAVLDIRMPLLFGYELTRRIRANPSISAIPIILLTASGESPAMYRGFDSGADEYITKPFDPQHLAERVRALLQNPAPSR